MMGVYDEMIFFYFVYFISVNVVGNRMFNCIFDFLIDRIG